MNKKNNPKEMVATKNKHKVLLCSTPEHQADSPSRDSDSVCDSDAASPVPFLCTQDGAEGETDVVWNFYTPKSENAATSRVKNSTPLSRKSKRIPRPKLIEKQLPKRRPAKISQKKTELFQDLIELNQNLHELIAKKQTPIVSDKQSGSEDDVFNSSPDCSPKCIPRSTSRCLRKNVLSSNFGKPDPDTALESDDSMNECLLKASQIVEEKILNYHPTPPKRSRYSIRQTNMINNESNFKIDQDSMDAILNSIKLDSPAISRAKKCNSPCLTNDSFDTLVGNLNDSALEQLTQMPVRSDIKNKTRNNNDWSLKELVVHDASPLSRSLFGRHNTMPESPIVDTNKPSTSGMTLGRYKSMPYDQQKDKSQDSEDSPIRCTPEEIKKKHQLARERLLAKRQLPFTSQSSQAFPTQVQMKKQQFQPKFAQNQPSLVQNQLKNAQNQTNVLQNVTKVVQDQSRSAQHVTKNVQFQPKVPSNSSNKTYNIPSNNELRPGNGTSLDIKSIIEKKRQEALMKLRRRQPHK